MLQDQDLLSVQEARSKVEKAYAAWQTYRHFSQDQVDAIVERMAAAARAHAQRLADLAVEETGYGNAADKRLKNLLSADLLARTLRGQRTIGVLREDPGAGITEIAVPMGVVAAILPTTNPTSTAIYKILIALKAGNAIVLSPHPRAQRCTCETTAALAKAAIEGGAPADLIQCLTNPTLEGTDELMRHKRTGVILSTGGSGIVRAAYSSGKPALGVGPGNVPVLLDPSADLPEAVGHIIAGKSFDFGTLCSSEQTVVAERAQRDSFLKELQAQGAHLCAPEQGQALAKLLFGPKFSVNPDCVGQPAAKIASLAGFAVPEQTRVLAVEISGAGKEHPLSAEKLSPVLALLFTKDFAASLDACEAILRFGGLGHTCGIYARDEARIREYALRMPAMRVLVNTPTPQGSVGITTNLFPAMTLGCGAAAGNVTGDNIGPQHLYNVKRLAYAVRSSQQAFAHPEPDMSSSDSPVDRQTIIAAVERFLARRGAPPKAAPPPPPPPPPPKPPEPPPPPPPAAPPPPPAPEPPVVDFVCENDVRAAMLRREKIYIGPKTIVTPAARDLAAPHGTLVLSERK